MGKTMPEILRELRNENKATQSDMANLLGLTTNAYQSYERGTSEPSCKALRILADFYNVSTDYLLGRTEVREMNTLPKDEPTEEEVKSLENQIVESYTQMSVETRRACIKALMQIVGDVFLDLQDEDEDGEEPQDSAG